MLLSIFLFFLLCAFTIRVKLPNYEINHSLDKMYQIRGILILLIILHHLVVCQGLTLIGPIRAKVLPHLGYLCVGVFLFMSGYGIESQRMRGGKFNLVKKSIFFILVFLLANTLSLLVSPLYQSYDGFRVEFKSYINGLFNGNPVLGSSWYLLNLTFLYLAYYFSLRNSKLLFSLVVSIILLTILYNIVSYKSIWYVSNFCFCIGVYYARMKLTIPVRPLYLCLLGILFIVLSVLPLLIGSWFKMPSMIISTIVLSLLFMLSSEFLRFKYKVWSFMGKHSLEIFLFHVIVYKILRGSVVYIMNDSLYVILTLALTIIISIPLSYFNQKLKVFVIGK